MRPGCGQGTVAFHCSGQWRFFLVHIKSQRCLVHTGKPKTVTADGDVVSRTPLNVVCKQGSLRVIGSKVVSTAANTEDRLGMPGTA